MRHRTSREVKVRRWVWRYVVIAATANIVVNLPTFLRWTHIIGR